MELFIFFALRIFPIFIDNFNNTVHNHIEICQIVDFVDIPVNFDNFTTFGQHAHVYRSTTGEYDAVRLKSIRNPVESSAVNNSLISIQENGKLIWLRPPNGTPFKGKPYRCRSSIITALLLLSSGDIQTNPGPCRLHNSRNLVLGSFNSRSAVNKAANIHDIISENNIDVLALQETWVTSDAPPPRQSKMTSPHQVS